MTYEFPSKQHGCRSVTQSFIFSIAAEIIFNERGSLRNNSDCTSSKFVVTVHMHYSVFSVGLKIQNGSEAYFLSGFSFLRDLKETESQSDYSKLFEHANFRFN